MRTLSIAVAIAACTVPAIARADEADDLFKEGVTAFDQKDFVRAEQLYERAFALRKSPDIAANLAQTEMALGKKGEAAEHLAYALRLLPATTPADVRASMQSTMASLRSEVGELAIESSVPGAEIEVGERVVGQAPIEAVFVMPGRHVVRARHPSYKTQEATMEVRAGATATLRLVLEPIEDRPPTGRPAWPIGVLAGGAAVGLGIGIAGIVLQQQRLSDADHALAALDDGACGPSGAACPDLIDDLDEAGGFLAMGVTGFSLAGALGIGALIYAVMPEGEKSSETSWTVVPVVGAQTGFMLQGRF